MQRFEAETVVQDRECDSSKSSPAIEEAAGQVAPARARRAEARRGGERRRRGNASRLGQECDGSKKAVERKGERTRERMKEDMGPESARWWWWTLYSSQQKRRGLAIPDRGRKCGAKPEAAIDPRFTATHIIIKSNEILMIIIILILLNDC